MRESVEPQTRIPEKTPQELFEQDDDADDDDEEDLDCTQPFAKDDDSLYLDSGQVRVIFRV